MAADDGQDNAVSLPPTATAPAGLIEPARPLRSGPTAIDLFSGAGGASLGLLNAGFDLRLAVDIDPTYSLTHRANLPGESITADLRQVDADKLSQAAGVGPGELDLLFAGPPCQGFSMIGSRVVWDERNNLFREVLRLAASLQPRAVVIENVPGLVTLAGGARSSRGGATWECLLATASRRRHTGASGSATSSQTAPSAWPTWTGLSPPVRRSATSRRYGPASRPTATPAARPRPTSAGCVKGLPTSCGTTTRPASRPRTWPGSPRSSLARTGATCRSTCCLRACSWRCARTTPAATGG